MIIPMATAADPSMFQYNVMQWVTTLSLSAVIIAIIVFAFKRYKLARQKFKQDAVLDPKSITMVFVLAGLAFVFFSVVVYATIGRRLSIILSEQLGLGYFQPLSLAFSIFMLGVLVFICGLVIAAVARKPRQKKTRQPKQHKETIAMRKERERREASSSESTGISSLINQ